jgi:hypothetical protein
MRFIIFRIAITGVEFSLFVHREGEAGTRDSGNMAEHDGKKETKRNEEKRRGTNYEKVGSFSRKGRKGPLPFSNGMVDPPHYGAPRGTVA